MKVRAHFGTAILAFGLAAATQVAPLLTDRYDFEDRSSRVSLAHRLDEASGLAVTADGRVFTHGDEESVIYEVDPAEGTVLKEFSLGAPIMRGDFEGLAVVGDRFYMINSEGMLLEFDEGRPDESVPFRGVDTGLGDRCEVEGLAFEPASQALIAACKTVPEEDEDFIVLYRIAWPDLLVDAAPIRVRLADLESVGLDDNFAPSGVEVDAETGTLFLISARQEAIVQITPTGQVLDGFHLGSKRHPQAEGIAVLPDGTLLLADESQGGRAHITGYSSR